MKIAENKLLPGINLIILNGKIILAISGIEVKVFSKRTAPILSLFWDLKQSNTDVFFTQEIYKCTIHNSTYPLAV